MYDRLLVPTDGSFAVERAISHAIDLAEVHGAAIDALYVVNATSYGGLPMETAWDGIGRALEDEGEAAVDRVRELAEARNADVPVRTCVVNGSPSRSIVDHARSNECDLIVMGTHGRGGIDRLLLGSVAERVVRAAPVPVTTVRVGDDEQDEAEGRSEAVATAE